MDMNYYFFSFSFQGANNGCCIVQSDTVENALQKTVDLKIHPPHDNIARFELFDNDNMELNRLYSPEEMKKNKGFESFKA
jgi:hypothetical protein